MRICIDEDCVELILMKLQATKILDLPHHQMTLPANIIPLTSTTLLLLLSLWRDTKGERRSKAEVRI